jgi:glycosyltransferase involved in cell wall biosynthesis
MSGFPPADRLRLLYLTGGNVPSRWAHTVQIMKMADGLADWCRAVTVLTERGLVLDPVARMDVHDWYRVSRRVRIRALPLRLRQREAFHVHSWSRRFDRAGSLYAWLTRPNLVYTRSPRAARMTARGGIPTVLEIHETIEQPGLDRAVLSLSRDPHFRGLVTITSPIRDWFVERGLDASRILVWPDAADPAAFATGLHREEARGRLGLDARRSLAIYVGHLYDHKGIPTLLEAAALLPAVSFVLVGGWPEDIERVRGAAAAAGLVNVLLAGFVSQEEVATYLAAADVVLLPNSGAHEQARKTSPLKLFEYMASGRPIVASAIPALSGLLEEGRNAALFRPDDAESLARAIHGVLIDPARGAAMADRAGFDVVSMT